MPGAMDATKRFDPINTRQILSRKGFDEGAIRRFCYRPFDLRWIYWESDTKLLDEKRSEYVPHVVPGNFWIEARQKQPMDAFDRGYVTGSLADNFGNGLSNFFPLLLHKPGDLLGDGEFHPNVAGKAEEYLAAIGASPEQLFTAVRL
jgi:hypothetical protein